MSQSDQPPPCGLNRPPFSYSSHQWTTFIFATEFSSFHILGPIHLNRRSPPTRAEHRHLHGPTVVAPASWMAAVSRHRPTSDTTECRWWAIDSEGQPIKSLSFLKYCSNWILPNCCFLWSGCSIIPQKLVSYFEKLLSRNIRVSRRLCNERYNFIEKCHARLELQYYLMTAFKEVSVLLLGQGHFISIWKGSYLLSHATATPHPKPEISGFVLQQRDNTI